MAYINFQPSDHFNTKEYTGTGAEHAITGIGFQPDFVWHKRSDSTSDHHLYDSIRGATYKFQVESGVSNVDAQSLKSFDSDGFTLGTNTASNASGGTFQAWTWKAAGSNASNGDGDITSTVRANTTAGFSIVSYTGTGSTATVGHGLGVAPKVILIKGRSHSGVWNYYNEALGNANRCTLNSSGAATSSSYMNSTSPTNQVFTVVNDTDVGTSGYTYMAYCFADVKGHSRSGLYYGNGNSNGPYVYLGFKPKFILTKNRNRNENWTIHDNNMESHYNPNKTKISPNDTSAKNQNNAFEMNFFSNGFKIITTDTALNQNGEGYLYLAFAEEPLVASNEVPATAR